MTCAVCRREARGFGFDPRLIGLPGRVAALCSMRCLQLYQERREMIDPTKHEISAMEAASPVAGEYIDSIGKTDMAAFSYEEWMTLIEVIVTAYTDRLRDLAASNEPPF